MNEGEFTFEIAIKMCIVGSKIAIGSEGIIDDELGWI